MKNIEIFVLFIFTINIFFLVRIMSSENFSPKEAIQNVASIYDKDQMTINNLTTTNKLESKNITKTNDLNVNNDLDVNKNTKIGGDLNVDKNTKIKGDLNVNKNTNIKGKLNINNKPFLPVDMITKGNVGGKVNSANGEKFKRSGGTYKLCKVGDKNRLGVNYDGLYYVSITHSFHASKHGRVSCGFWLNGKNLSNRTGVHYHNKLTQVAYDDASNRGIYHPKIEFLINLKKGDYFGVKSYSVRSSIFTIILWKLN